jgi:hypothetical protein
MDTPDVVIHEDHQTRGSYVIDGLVLRVDWDDFPSEQFIQVEGVYVHVSLVGRALPATLPDAAE